MMSDYDRVKLVSKQFYRYTENDNLCEYVPILSVYVGNLEKEHEKREENEYIYMIFNEGEHQLRIIKKELILRLIKEQKVKRIELTSNNSNKEDTKLIEMGLSELTLDNISGLLNDDNVVVQYE